MTRLEKTAAPRCTRGAYQVLYPYNPRKARPIVVRLAQGDLIEFRELGRQKWFPLPIDIAFKQAVRRQAAQKASKKDD